MKLMQRIWGFLRRETVLCAALLLAVISAFFVPPDRAYFGYIDWNTLLLLFALMAVTAGLEKCGLFGRVGTRLLLFTSNTRQMLLVLVFLPFFFSMLITNDVALITFVPLGMTVLRLACCENLMIPLVVMQTVAANLGSMLTPMGNPQNLYLFAQSGMSLGAFLLLMLPYTLLSLACLLLAVLLLRARKLACLALDMAPVARADRYKLLCYGAAFVLCLICVADVLPPLVAAVAVTCYLLAADREVLAHVDYSLLGTFAGFFVFIGNLGRIDAFSGFLSDLLAGHVTLVSVLASQVISNVPAALLLSGFSGDWPALIVGANLGGLGTLIASMASLISYKQVARQYPAQKGRYLLAFTVANLIMLGVLLLLNLVLMGVR